MALKAFVTGANGFIGSFLSKHLAEQELDVHAFILKGTDIELLKNIYPSMKNITVIEGNILDSKLLELHLKNFDYVFHLAGVIQGYDQKDFDRINLDGSRNILNACLKNNPNLKRLILMSSSTAAGIGTPEDPLTEDKPPQPELYDFYGKSKYRMELLARKYKNELPITIVRSCVVLGPGNKVIQGNYTVIKRGIKFLSPGPRREISIIDVEDLVNGIYLCATVPNAKDEVFYFCCDGSLSLADMQEITNYKIFNRKYGSLITIPIPKPLLFVVATLMELAAKLRKKPAPFLNRQKVPAAYAKGQVVCAEKAKRILGWSPQHSIVSTVTREGNWFKKHGWIK